MLQQPIGSRVRGGFTMVELLVAIAVIAALAALLLPAVQSVRESARQAECVDHIKNIATAMHAFATIRRDRLPMMGVPEGHPGEFRGWPVAILAQVEQKPLLDKLADPAYDPSKDSIPVYVCPSDPTADSRQNSLSYSANAGYAGRVDPTATPTWLKGGPTSSMVYSNWHLIESSDGGRETGLFWVNGNPVGLNEVTVKDGTTNTLMLADNSQAETWSDKVWEMFPPNTIPDRKTLYALSSTGFVIGDDAIQLGEESTINDPVSPRMLTIHSIDLDHYSINYNVNHDHPAEGLCPAPNSYHPGGVMVAYADTHTAFLNESIDQQVYARSITWGGGILKENDGGNGGSGNTSPVAGRPNNPPNNPPRGPNNPPRGPTNPNF
jgi:prepilin-type N-terminal cleavage/methylation domain-containing protein/prepilin-type processing-associated H-X9-DG protein